MARTVGGIPSIFLKPTFLFILLRGEGEKENLSDIITLSIHSPTVYISIMYYCTIVLHRNDSNAANKGRLNI